MTDTIFIGIAGGTGSGKTTLTQHIKKRFGDAVSVIYHDNYYKDQTGVPFEVRCRQNYDHPDAFDTDLMIRHLKALKAGVPVQCPVYSYTDHNRTAETVEIRPTSVVIVEGLLIFQNPELRDLLDIKIFVDTDADVRILRRIMRDVKERGRSLIRWWSSTSPPSNPCMSSSWSPPSATLTSSCWRAVTTWWPWT